MQQAFLKTDKPRKKGVPVLPLGNIVVVCVFGLFIGFLSSPALPGYSYYTENYH